MQVKCVLLTEDLQRQTERNVKRFNLNIVRDTKKVYLKSRLRGGVEVEHVARGGRCGGVWADGDTSLRLAEGR